MTFNIYLAILSVVYYIILNIIARKDKLKMELGISFLFVLVVYFLAVTPNYSKVALAAFLTMLVIFNIHVMTKKR